MTLNAAAQLTPKAVGCSGMLAQWRIGNEPLSEAHHLISGVTDAPIELQHRVIRSADLQIQLGATTSLKRNFDAAHERAAKASIAMLWRNSQVIHPTPVAIKPGHDRSDKLACDLTDQKQFRLSGELALNVLVRIVPRPHKIAATPKLNYCGFI